MLQHSVKQCQPFYFIKEKRLFNITILIFEKEKLFCIRNLKKKSRLLILIMIISVIVIVTFNHIADLKSNEQTITKKNRLLKDLE